MRGLDAAYGHRFPPSSPPVLFFSCNSAHMFARAPATSCHFRLLPLLATTFPSWPKQKLGPLLGNRNPKHPGVDPNAVK